MFYCRGSQTLGRNYIFGGLRKVLKCKCIYFNIMFIQTYEKTINNYSIFPVTKIENVYMLIYIYLNILL